jgi:hypothetical protein
MDARTHHAALPVERGIKLAANHWIHLRNYKTPNLHGCTGSQRKVFVEMIASEQSQGRRALPALAHGERSRGSGSRDERGRTSGNWNELLQLTAALPQLKLFARFVSHHEAVMDRRRFVALQPRIDRSFINSSFLR